MALHTMVVIANADGDALSARAIAERLVRSEAHMSKVLQRLARAGLVSGSRGPLGGFVLARPAEEIHMLEVYEAIEGKLGDVNCTWTPTVCDGQTCVFGQLVKLVNRQVIEYLGGIRLSELELRGLGRLVRTSGSATKKQRSPLPAT